MSLRDKIQDLGEAGKDRRLYQEYGLVVNPFPSSNQTSDNPHFAIGGADERAETEIAAFIRDNRSRAVVVEGTQGVGKTNFLNHFEEEIKSVSSQLPGYYVVRYLADPETTFDGTIRRLLQEMGVEHFRKLAESLRNNKSHIESARSQEVKIALHGLANSATDIAGEMMDWLLGLRLLKVHRESLGVQFRLDTVESKTSALRDIVEVSNAAGILNGIFLLLDELEKQDGVLGPRAVVRYLSALRAIIDALPRGLFLMVAVTPDALRRYSIALSALRGRLLNRIELTPLQDVGSAIELAEFYVDSARDSVKHAQAGIAGTNEILLEKQIRECYEKLIQGAERRGDDGVRQREFLHELYKLAESIISSGGKGEANL